MISASLDTARSAGRKIQRIMPSPVRYAMKSLYHGVLLPMTYKSIGEHDAAILRKHEIDRAPPPIMRHRVHGAPDLDSFLTVGKINFDDILTGMGMAGITLTSDSTVLDFGCGSGRTLLQWMKHDPRPKLFATDIDPAAITWVQDNLPVATNVNGFDPPLPYADGQMDIVYAISVLTHLDEDAQDKWLTEIRRITKVGGVALLSIHSNESNASLTAGDQDILKKAGFYFLKGYAWRARYSARGIIIHTTRMSISAGTGACTSMSSDACRWGDRI